MVVALAAERGGDTMKRRGAEGLVPEGLGVVVRVDLDEARCPDQSVGVNRGWGAGAVTPRRPPQGGARPGPGWCR